VNALTMIFLTGVATSFRYSGTRCDYLQTLEKAQRLTGRVAVARQILYNGGRVVSYVLLGGLGGLLIAEPTIGRVSEIVFAPRALAILSGALLILGAVWLHGRVPSPAPSW
jgi:sulfite exporter TauE/SafE